MTMANITLTSAKRDAILRGLEAKRRPIHWTAGKILLAGPSRRSSPNGAVGSSVWPPC